jgi:hypothetical protein
LRAEPLCTWAAACTYACVRVRVMCAPHTDIRYRFLI